MIPHDKHVTVQWIELGRLRVGEPLARDVDWIFCLVQKLEQHKSEDLTPIEVEPVPGGYQIINGHHRFCAYIIAGRKQALCLVLR